MILKNAHTFFFTTIVATRVLTLVLQCCSNFIRMLFLTLPWICLLISTKWLLFKIGFHPEFCYNVTIIF